MEACINAGLAFESPVPTVSCAEASCGGAQDGNASGAPCVRFGAAHATLAVTSANRVGVAPLGRAYELTGTGCQFASMPRVRKVPDPPVEGEMYRPKGP